ncbi:hypothetical protein [Mucilaginibacter myungsuensis]|uniref:Uncharacterized protein n=1 Tax=Mucilaginibacter myungsuensis TaxID=649104 RepID=A0A929PUP9_9SPHI|nr:hypothetical protein [Mucilaginibacter myungsuensis]MBE9660993.1 hypothetical protein [Mucilaginibacter myungsuensis]MDN3601039.1 hypothetical protein [Mucilaginibacter myungsuensis]
MKIITASTNWNTDRLYQTLQDKLDPLFKGARQIDAEVKVNKVADSIEVGIPEFYDGYLFKLTAEGRELHVAKSEHYVDDINQLTLQSILETLQMEDWDGADIVKISGE